MSDVSKSGTPLNATFRIKLNGETVAIKTVGEAYRFITSLSTVEWMEFQSLHEDAKAALEAAAENAMLSVRATHALRALFMRAKLL
jgi:cell division inhibitor SulA